MFSVKSNREMLVVTNREKEAKAGGFKERRS